MDIEKLRKRFKDREASATSDSDKKFDSMFDLSSNLVLEVVKNIQGRKAKIYHEQTKRNFIINLVMCLEVYFKNLICEKKFWKKEGFDELLKEKITLNQAYQLFRKDKITRRFIISQHSSFQSIESTNYVFSKLTGVDFLKAVEETKFEEDSVETSLLKTFPDWRKIILKIYDLRNRIVHEGYDKPIPDEDLDLYYEIVFEFQTAVYLFILEMEYEHLKRKLKKKDRNGDNLKKSNKLKS